MVDGVAEAGAPSALTPAAQPGPGARADEAGARGAASGVFRHRLHATNPSLSQRFALPRELHDAGVQRYGFHGLSYEFIASRLRLVDPVAAKGAHGGLALGQWGEHVRFAAGCSVASTMGFTALDGLMMGTRCGTIDPGVLLWLMDERGMNARQIESLLYKQSGLQGVSGLSSDMRTLLASDDPRAAQAVDLYLYRIARELGSWWPPCRGSTPLSVHGGHWRACRADSLPACAVMRPGWVWRWTNRPTTTGRWPPASAPHQPARQSGRGLGHSTNEELMIARHTRERVPDFRQRAVSAWPLRVYNRRFDKHCTGSAPLRRIPHVDGRSRRQNLDGRQDGGVARCQDPRADPHTALWLRRVEGVRAYNTVNGPPSSASRNTPSACSTAPRFCACPCLSAWKKSCRRNSTWSNQQPGKLLPASAGVAGLRKMGVSPKGRQRCTSWSRPGPGVLTWKKVMKRGIPCQDLQLHRHHVNITMTQAKSVSNYTNSILANLEATEDGYDEAMLLDSAGFVSEGAGENLFIIRMAALFTPDLSAGASTASPATPSSRSARTSGLEIRKSASPATRSTSVTGPSSPAPPLK